MDGSNDAAGIVRDGDAADSAVRDGTLEDVRSVIVACPPDLKWEVCWISGPELGFYFEDLVDAIVVLPKKGEEGMLVSMDALGSAQFAAVVRFTVGVPDLIWGDCARHSPCRCRIWDGLGCRRLG
ncbi:hypothetical protein ACLOJK_018934 [Asimina triloba]